MKKVLVSLVSMLLIAIIAVSGMFFMVTPSSAQGGVTGFSSLRILAFYRAVPRPAITMTQDATLNPTGTYQRLTAAGAVSTSGASIVVEPAGSLVILVNVGSNTITFTETGTLISAGNIALGAGDSATLVSDGTNWTQIAASNN
jgi:hypothetical protein